MNGDIYGRCLSNEDGDWFCPIDGTVTKHEMAREIAAQVDEPVEEVAGQVKRGFMRPVDGEQSAEYSHMVCDANAPGAAPYWIWWA